MAEVLVQLEGRGPHGSASSRRSAARPSSSRSRACRSGTSSTSSSAATRPSAHKPRPGAAAARARAARRRRRTTPPTSATRRSTSRPRAPPACYAVGVSWGGIHDRERARAERRRVVDTRGGAACRPLSRRPRAAELRELARPLEPTRTTSSTTRRSTTPSTTGSTTSSSSSRQSIPELVTPDSPTQRVGAAALGPVPEGRSTSTPMGSLEKVTTDEALAKWADDVRKRLDTRRAGRVRDRAEDRRARDQPHLRGRRASCAARRAATASRART